MPESQNGTNYHWTAISERAAKLLADDQLTDEQIASDLGISRRQLARWKDLPVFQGRIDEIVAAYRERIKTRGIADKLKRVDALNDRWMRMRQVIDERAEDPELQEVAGGKTGLLVKQVKGIGKGADFQMVEEYAVDTGLLAELRNHEKQAAQELGQWTEKSEWTGKDGGPIEVAQVDLSKLKTDELRTVRELLAKASQPRSDRPGVGEPQPQ